MREGLYEKDWGCLERSGFEDHLIATARQVLSISWLKLGHLESLIRLGLNCAQPFGPVQDFNLSRTSLTGCT
jgi:hypothetical protein